MVFVRFKLASGEEMILNIARIDWIMSKGGGLWWVYCGGRYVDLTDKQVVALKRVMSYSDTGDSACMIRDLDA